jgi:hypothetical protein
VLLHPSVEVLRRFVLVLPLLLVTTAACSSSQEEERGGSSASVKSGSCSASRDEILSGTSALRARAIERGFGWLDANVPYSQSASHGGYRTDCSGFVSMCWELGTSTNTGSLVSSTTYASKLSSWDALLPADALLRQGHVMLFVGWEPGKSSVCVLEQASTASDMQFRVKSVASLKSQGFKPIRAKKLAADTGAATGGEPAPDTGADPEQAGTTPEPEGSTPDPTPADPTPADPTPTGPTTCVSRSAAAVCGEAAADGVECGPVIDECGRAVSCDGVAGFGCATGEKCSATQQCIPVATTPPPSTTPPSTTTPPMDPPVSDTLPAPGDPGDAPTESPSEGDPAEGTTSTKVSRSASAPTASSGCSISSSTGSRDGLHLLGVAVALCALRRRKRP